MKDTAREKRLTNLSSRWLGAIRERKASLSVPLINRGGLEQRGGKVATIIIKPIIK